MSHRRGACPSLSAPMETGDGLLVRLHPAERRLSGCQLAGLARAARRFGNGVLEITARGGLQIRGLTAESAAAFAAEVEVLAIEASSGVAVETGPLASLDASEIADPRPLAWEIRRRIEAIGLSTMLGPKVSVTVDGGGALRLGEIIADVKLEAIKHPPSPLWGGSARSARAGVRRLDFSLPTPLRFADRPSPQGGGWAPRWLIRVGGTSATARIIGCFDENTAADITIQILEALAERGRNARTRDLSHRELKAITGYEPLSGCAPIETQRLPVGGFSLIGGERGLGFVLAYGQIESGALYEFAQAIGENAELRLAPGRGLIVLDTAAREDNLPAMAEALGLVTRPDDPRLSIAICAGKPACASAHLATKQLAERLLARRPELLDGAFRLHLSGCEKQCARPSGPSVTLIGIENGHRIKAEAAELSPELKTLLAALAAEQRRQTV